MSGTFDWLEERAGGVPDEERGWVGFGRTFQFHFVVFQPPIFHPHVHWTNWVFEGCEWVFGGCAWGFKKMCVGLWKMWVGV